MYDHQLRIHGEHLASNQTLPKNTRVTGNGGGQRAGSLMGAAEIVMRASAKVTLAAAKSVSILLEDSDENTTFAAVPVLFKFTNGASAATWEAGEAVGRLPLPSNVRRYVRIALETDDAAASGSVDVNFDYLPR